MVWLNILYQKGVKVKIFCADFLHGVDEAIEIEDGKYTCKTGEDGVEYVIIKTTAYKNNGLSRIKNMIDYYFRVRKVANEIAKRRELQILYWLLQFTHLL